MQIPVERAPWDAGTHLLNMALLTNAGTATTVSQMTADLDYFFDDDDIFVFIPESAVSTKTVIVVNLGKRQLCVIACGITLTNIPLVSAILSGWGTSLLSQGPNAYDQAATLIYSSLGMVPVAGFSEARLVGHSFGGAMCMNLIRKLATNLANVSGRYCYTYGAPKPGKRGEIDADGTWYYRRCFLNLDPVPGLPPTPATLSFLWVLLGEIVARRLGRWWQPITGMVYDGFGHLIESENPTPQPVRTNYFSLVNWLISQEGYGSDNHSLAVYYDQTRQLVFSQDQASTPHFTRPRNTEPELTRNQLTIMRDEVLATVGAQVQQLPMDAAATIANGVPQVQGTRYRGVTVGGKPWVYYGSTPVIPTKSRRTRRALVRYLNRQL